VITVGHADGNYCLWLVVCSLVTSRLDCDEMNMTSYLCDKMIVRQTFLHSINYVHWLVWFMEMSL